MNKKLLPVVLIGIFFLNFLPISSPTLIQRTLATALLMIASLPFLFWKKGEIPFLPFFSGIYAIYYATPIFLREKYSRAYYLDDLIQNFMIEKVLAFSIIGLVLLYSGYTFLKKTRFTVRLNWTDDRILLILGIACSLIGLATYFTHLVDFEIPLFLKNARLMIGDLSLIGIAILYAVWIRKSRSSVLLTIFLWAMLVPMRIIFGFAAGATFQGITVIMLLAMISSVYHRKIAWNWLIFGLLMIIIIRPLQTDFRKLVKSFEIAESINRSVAVDDANSLEISENNNDRESSEDANSLEIPENNNGRESSEDANSLEIPENNNDRESSEDANGLEIPESKNTISAFERITLFSTLSNSLFNEKFFQNLPGRVEIVASRLGHLMTFAEVVSLTPSSIPYWDGFTYQSFGSKIIPRFLYPGKPVERLGQVFGHRYNFLNENDTSTSYNLPQLIEFYVNFGLLGVAAGMFLLGVLYKANHLLFSSNLSGIGSNTAGIFVSLKLLTSESNLSSVIGGVWWAMVTIWGIHLAYVMLVRIFSNQSK